MDKRIGAQLYTCRKFCQTIEGLDSTMKKVSEIGYKAVQISGVPREFTGRQIKECADRYGLKIACTHRDFDEFTERFDETVQLHKDMDCSIAGLGALTPQALESKENFYEFVKQADEVAEKLGECGIKFIYHNHSQEFAKLDGKTMLDYMMENTCDNFNLVLDVYWAANAGVYPVTVMEKYAGRIPVIHYKDRKVVHWNDTDMCEIGQGVIDWDAIIDASERTGVEWAMVEQDWGWTDDDPFKALEISYKFLTEKGFI